MDSARFILQFELAIMGEFSINCRRIIAWRIFARRDLHRVPIFKIAPFLIGIFERFEEWRFELFGVAHGFLEERACAGYFTVYPHADFRGQGAGGLACRDQLKHKGLGEFFANAVFAIPCAQHFGGFWQGAAQRWIDETLLHQQEDRENKACQQKKQQRSNQHKSVAPSRRKGPSQLGAQRHAVSGEQWS